MKVYFKVDVVVKDQIVHHYPKLLVIGFVVYRMYSFTFHWVMYKIFVSCKYNSNHALRVECYYANRQIFNTTRYSFHDLVGNLYCMVLPCFLLLYIIILCMFVHIYQSIPSHSRRTITTGTLVLLFYSIDVRAILHYYKLL